MSHIYRDVNYCVNVLVKMGHDGNPTRFMLDISVDVRGSGFLFSSLARFLQLRSSMLRTCLFIFYSEIIQPETQMSKAKCKEIKPNTSTFSLVELLIHIEKSTFSVIE